MLTAFLASLLLGAVGGTLAGLLGVGGGIVIVPGVLAILSATGVVTPHAQHLALGTSLATIVVTGLSSARAHHARGGVDWALWRTIAPAVVIGTLGGAKIAAHIDGTLLAWFFVAFACVVATQMLTGATPPANRTLPGAWLTRSVGLVIGLLSSWVGIGGGSLSVPFMSWHNVPMKTAIGTSAAIGLPIAAAGAAGYVWAGWGEALPAGTLGFVYLPALAGIALASWPMARFGAALAHKLPVSALKRGFALLLLVVAARMAWQLLHR
ncbi:sulfite exporter TauE/SafE family protein [Chitinibacteraceae bacterium HSL-7]